MGLVTLAACSGDGAIDGPVLSSPSSLPFTGGGMDAIVSGELTYDAASSCLYLTNGEFRDAVVWPGGARWRPDPPAVLIGDLIIEPGQTVQGSGGYVSHRGVANAAGETVADAAAACGDQIALFNADSNLSVEG